MGDPASEGKGRGGEGWVTQIPGPAPGTDSRCDARKAEQTSNSTAPASSMLHGGPSIEHTTWVVQASTDETESLCSARQF